MSHPEAVGVASGEYLHSNLSVPHGLMVAGSIAAHERYMEQTGADGMEVTPTNVSLFMSRVVSRAQQVERQVMSYFDYSDDYIRNIPKHMPDYHQKTPEDEAITRLVRSRHSPFRKDENDNGLIARQFPRLTKGLGQLSAIRYVTSETPLVVYAGIPDETTYDGVKAYDDENASASIRTHQPKAHEWAKLDISENSEVDEIIDVLGRHGIDSTTFDVFHALASVDGHYFNNPIALAHKLARAGHVDAIHLAVNRLDSAPRGTHLAKDTNYAEQAFTYGVQQAKYTPEGEMVAVIAEEWRTNPLYDGKTTRLVLEEGPFGLHTAKSQTAMLATAREMIQR